MNMGDAMYSSTANDRVCRCGGTGAGTHCGMFCFYLGSVATFSYSDISFRVVFIFCIAPFYFIFSILLFIEAASSIGDHMWASTASGRVYHMGGHSSYGSVCGMFSFNLDNGVSLFSSDGFRVIRLINEDVLVSFLLLHNYVDYIFVFGMGVQMWSYTASGRVCATGCSSLGGQDCSLFYIYIHTNASGSYPDDGFHVF